MNNRFFKIYLNSITALVILTIFTSKFNPLFSRSFEVDDNWRAQTPLISIAVLIGILNVMSIIIAQFMSKSPLWDEDSKLKSPIFKGLLALIIVAISLGFSTFILNVVSSKTGVYKDMLMEYYTIDVILLFTVCITSFFTLIMGSVIIIQTIRRRKELGLDNLGKFGFFFFASSMISIVVVSFFFIIGINYGSTPHHAIESLIIFFVGFLTLNSFTASFLFMAKLCWSTNKILSSVMLLFAIINISPIFFLFYSGIPHENGMRRINYVETKNYSVPVPITNDYYPSLDEEDNDSQDRENENNEHFHLDFLWDNPKADRDSVQSALEFYTAQGYIRDSPLSSITVYSDATLSKFQKSEEKGIYPYYKIISHVSSNRSNKAIRGIYEAYKELAFSAVTSEQYEKYLREDINLMITVYNDISDDSHVLEEIYSVMSSNNYNSDKARFKKLQPLMGKDMLIGYINEEFSSHSLVKAYAFWARRWKDGNSDACIEIFRELNDTYYSELYEEDYYNDDDEY